MKSSKSLIILLAVLFSCCQNSNKQSYSKLDIIYLDSVQDGLQLKDIWLIKGADTFQVGLNYLEENLSLNVHKNSKKFSGDLMIGRDYCRLTDRFFDKVQFRRDFYYWNNGIFVSRIMENHKRYGEVVLSEIEYQNRVKLWKKNWVFDLYIDSDTVYSPEQLKYQVLTDKRPEYKELSVLGRLVNDVESRFDTLLSANRISSRFEEKTLILSKSGLWELKFVLKRHLPITDPKAVTEYAFDEISAFVYFISDESKRK